MPIVLKVASVPTMIVYVPLSLSARDLACVLPLQMTMVSVHDCLWPSEMPVPPSSPRLVNAIVSLSQVCNVKEKNQAIEQNLLESYSQTPSLTPFSLFCRKDDLHLAPSAGEQQGAD